MDETEMRQWCVLLGAMLASKGVREQAQKVIGKSDVPENLRSMWLALQSGDPGSVWDAARSLGLPDERGESKGVLATLLRSLSAKALRRFCVAVMHRTDGLGKIEEPERIADTLEKWAAEIRARKAVGDE